MNTLLPKRSGKCLGRLSFSCSTNLRNLFCILAEVTQQEGLQGKGLKEPRRMCCTIYIQNCQSVLQSKKIEPLKEGMNEYYTPQSGECLSRLGFSSFGSRNPLCFRCILQEVTKQKGLQEKDSRNLEGCTAPFALPEFFCQNDSSKKRSECLRNRGFRSTSNFFIRGGRRWRLCC